MKYIMAYLPYGGCNIFEAPFEHGKVIFMRKYCAR